MENNRLSNVPSDSVNCLTMITNNTIRDCVTTTTAKESNLIDVSLSYPYKAESTINTYEHFFLRVDIYLHFHFFGLK